MCGVCWRWDAKSGYGRGCMVSGEGGDDAMSLKDQPWAIKIKIRQERNRGRVPVPKKETLRKVNHLVITAFEITQIWA